MKTKRIVFTAPETVKFLEEDLPEMTADRILVKTAVSTISSGTERANLKGTLPVNVDRPQIKVPDFPRHLGYCSAGVIEKVGAEVSGFQPGDRVAVAWGTHSQYQLASERRVYKIGDIPFADAGMFLIGTFPLAAIRKCRLEIGESAIVMGMGVLGLVSLQLLKAAGAVPVIAVDPDPAKREKALASGADYALDPTAADFAERAKALTNGGANVGIEVTGIGAGLNGILDCMARFGRVALLGCTRSADFTVDYYHKVHGPGITLIGAHTNARPRMESSSGWWTQKDDINALIRLTAMGRIHLAELVDETASPADSPAVYERLLREKTFPIVQFKWE